MTMDYIRKTYGLNVKRGDRVEYHGSHPIKLGTVAGARDGRLRILLDGEKYPKSFHPTWMIKFLVAEPS